jgi:hypothetical protein
LSSENAAILARVRQFQRKFNLYADPVRGSDVIFAPEEHVDAYTEDMNIERYGSELRENLKFETHVSAIDPSTSRLFVYGAAQFAGHPEKRNTVMSMHITDEGMVDECVQFVDYFHAESEKMANAATLDDTCILHGTTLQAESTLTGERSLTTPNAIEPSNTALMLAKVRSLVSAWGCGVSSHGTMFEPCRITLPLQRITLGPSEMASGWVNGSIGAFSVLPGAVHLELIRMACAEHHHIVFAEVSFLVAHTKTTPIKGILVAEFNRTGRTLEKLVLFRDFSSSAEHALVFKG